MIITGNLPYKTEVSSVYIFGRIESGDGTAAAATAVVLLVSRSWCCSRSESIRYFDRDEARLVA